MRTVWLGLAFYFWFGIAAQGQQKVFSVEEAERSGIGISVLDSAYDSRAPVDDPGIKIKTQKRRFRKSDGLRYWFRDFQSYLRKKRFEWQETTTCSYHLYFNADGSVAWILFGLSRKPPLDQPSGELQETFKQLLLQYLSKNPLRAATTVRFKRKITYGYLGKKVVKNKRSGVRLVQQVGRE